ncbi:MULTISPECIES: MFS transporter [Neisseria]|uniref:Major Facilitator Superfamily protein n=1 Tax=Neisseria musculi TaxID=1815583 RepID=A0A7H1MEP5_9NEIS|nr:MULTISPECIES: MFS transporter [Neisseria]MBF0803810.1 MFS transporter [Neisseria sp. 19428wB4_WF04]QNT60110.1 major Facilitator Superfamily protein [Neisseria musculi]TFU43481.1 MFS transporter [Neisseria sp. WF04]
MRIDHRVAMTLRQIVLMNFGFFGIQYSFGLQQTAINPIFSFLQADPGQLPLLNMAGPVTGLLVQPLIGALSDRTWINGLGRRRPYFLIGAVGCSICLFFYPHVTALWMAVLMLWLLDISNNTAMEPYRAFIADKLPDNQQPTGFLMQSVFTGLGITLANVSLYFFQQWITGTSESGIPYWVYGSFYIGAVCSIGSVLISVFSTPENRPSDAELAEMRAKPRGLIPAVKEIASAIKDMPKPLWQLALVYLFQWYAMFIYWQYVTLSIAKSVWGATQADKQGFEQAVGWTGLVNGWYNIVTFISAFGLMALARKYSAKQVHALCLIMAAVALLIFPHITNKYLLFLPMIGFGIAWASIMGVPFLIAVAEVPKERYGVYMGIINMMIVIPMLIETVTFGPVFNHVLGANPTNAMMCAGVLLGLAAFFTLRVNTKQRPAESSMID